MHDIDCKKNECRNGDTWRILITSILRSTKCMIVKLYHLVIKSKSIYSLARNYSFAPKVMSLPKTFVFGENYSQTFEDVILIECKVIVLLQKMMDFTKHFTLVENIQKSFEDILLSKHEGVY